MISDSSSLTDWVKCFEPRRRFQLRLFCFPYAGGGTSLFRHWSDNLPEEVEVCSIRLPGRESRLAAPPFIRLEPLVQTLAQILGPHIGNRYAFFGHSMGALIGYELSRELRRRGLPGPDRLYVAAHRAPHLPSRTQPLHHIPDPEFLAELRRLGGTPEELLQHSELRQLLLPTVRADFAVCETYRHRPDRPLNCPIVAFGGLNDSVVSHEELNAWRNHTVGSFILHMLPGDHFFIHSADGSLLRTLAQDLVQLLSQESGRNLASGGGAL